MPAINVARTDTFEQQRVKINQIGSSLFNLTSGGSDLAAGNLKLGDGTRINPSLSFDSDNTLGLYKADTSTIGYVASEKKIFDISKDNIISYKDIIVRQTILNDTGISILNFGSNYDTGNYTDIPLIGGTGDLATADILVTAFNGTVLDDGENYNPGFYSNILLTGGSGIGAIVTFEVDPISGNISDAGSGYAPGIYTDINFINGSGTNATCNVTIDGSTDITGSITSPGSGYTQGTYQGVQILNSPTQTFVVTTTANPGTPPPDDVFVIDGIAQQSLTLVKGNTYRFDLSDSSLSAHPFGFADALGSNLPSEYYVTSFSGAAGFAGSFLDLVIKEDAPTETIQYYCLVHQGMGANISVVSGVTGNYGTFGTADIEVDAAGQVVSFTFSNVGEDYKVSDVISASSLNIGSTGSGFLYTIQSIIYDGSVTQIVVVDSGQNYVEGDILSINDADVGGGGGSGFEFTVTSKPGKVVNLDFVDKGSGYLVNDILTFPTGVTNISTNLNGQISDLTTTLSTGSPIVSLSDTTGILPGMTVFNTGISDVGFVSGGSTVLSVDSPTQVTLSQNPSSSGTATLTFRTLLNESTIEVNDVSGISTGDNVTQLSGSGILPSGITVLSINTSLNQITLSGPASSPGSAILEFTPQYGVSTSPFTYQIDNLGVIDSFTISSGGNGYSVSDQLTVNPTDLSQPIVYVVENRNVHKLTFTSTLPDTTFSPGDVLKVADGEIIQFTVNSSPQVLPTTVGPFTTTVSTASPIITITSTAGISPGYVVTQDFAQSTGFLDFNTTVLSVDSATQITLSSNPISDGTAVLSFSTDESGTFTNIVSTSSGIGSGATFDVTRSSDGNISDVSINSTGEFYQIADTITISGSSIGGVSPDHDISISVDQVVSSQDLEIYKVISSNGNIDSILIDFSSVTVGDNLVVSGTTSPSYEIDTTGSLEYRWFIDTGSGPEFKPDLTLYVGNTYTFDLSDPSNSSHQLAFSEYRDGSFNRVDNVATTVSTTSDQLIVTDPTGILLGMEVISQTGPGSIATDTFVSDINGNVITLSKFPLTSGLTTLLFRGTEYTQGVERTGTSLSIRITDTTTTPLYYYCSFGTDEHQNEAGEDGEEATITIDPNNPKIFGSGFLASVIDLSVTDVIVSDIETGDFNAVNLISTSLSSTSAQINSLNCPSISSVSIGLDSIIANGNSIQVTSPSFSLSGNLVVGSSLSINGSSGNIETIGYVKTTNIINVNDSLFIDSNIISTSTGLPIVLRPPLQTIINLDANTGLRIPVGVTGERPSSPVDGLIRFNSTTNQYEGYSSVASAWSSLGGVRDLDGNTYILAEETVGANDNTLWFINDNINTIKVTPDSLRFENIKSIRSSNVNAPSYVEWTANTPVLVGDYLKNKNNLYEVISSGTTASSGNSPTFTSGTSINGTATLSYWGLAVAPLTFEDIEVVKIGPLSSTPLSINNDLRLNNNIISTDINDLTLRPNSGKKIICDASTTFVLPSGSDLERGTPVVGSVRFNTTSQQYEGYDGINWGSLGGVKDVDQNTYIIPELSPGSNENILYFFNDNNNTLQLTTSSLDFYSVDTIRSVTSDELEITASLLTFDNGTSTFDNTASDRTFLHTTKQYFDLGLSAGLTTDPVLRLDDLGDVFFNIGFGTGTLDLVKVFDSDLKEFELADIKILTEKLTLVKGTFDNGSSELYAIATNAGCKTTVIAVNPTSGDKEFIEFGVLDNGTDVFHTEYGNIRTGTQLIVPTFEVTGSNIVRINIALGVGVNPTESVNITVVSDVTKK